MKELKICKGVYTSTLAVTLNKTRRQYSGIRLNIMETMQCPFCGTMNDTKHSLCTNCQSPLTAYSGELRGEIYQGNLAGQVERLRVRPWSVNLMAAFLVVVAVGWPLRSIVTAFVNRAQLNGEATNYLASAFGAIGPIMTTILCLPLAAILGWIAWSVLTQQPRAWKLSLVAISAFAVYILIRSGEYRIWTVIWLVLTAGLAAVWLRGPTRAWFGMQ